MLSAVFCAIFCCKSIENCPFVNPDLKVFTCAMSCIPTSDPCATHPSPRAIHSAPSPIRATLAPILAPIRLPGPSNPRATLAPWAPPSSSHLRTHLTSLRRCGASNRASRTAVPPSGTAGPLGSTCHPGTVGSHPALRRCQASNRAPGTAVPPFGTAGPRDPRATHSDVYWGDIEQKICK